MSARHRLIRSSAAQSAGNSWPKVATLEQTHCHNALYAALSCGETANDRLLCGLCDVQALYELSLFDAADAVAVDHDYDVQQYKALLANVAAQRAASKRPASSGVKEAEEQKTNDEQPTEQQATSTASPTSTVTNVCTFDLKHCGPPGQLVKQ